MGLMITTNCPKWFFGRPTNSITCEADAINAIRTFCEMAPADVVSATAEELKALSKVNPAFYEVINGLLWKVELPLGSYGWHNHFELLNCSLK